MMILLQLSEWVSVVIILPVFLRLSNFLGWMAEANFALSDLI
jgi:hypothetical protein